MKYLKTYNESFAGAFKKVFNLEKSFDEWWNDIIIHNKTYNKNYSPEKIDCSYKKIINLKGIEKFSWNL